MPIDALHRLARGEAEDEMRIGAQIMSDDARDEQRRGIFRRLNDDFHGRELSRNGTGCHEEIHRRRKGKE
jgi:hypothetical protein